MSDGANALNLENAVVSENINNNESIDEVNHQYHEELLKNQSLPHDSASKHVSGLANYTDDIKNYRFNNAVAKIRELSNKLVKQKAITADPGITHAYSALNIIVPILAF